MEAAGITEAWQQSAERANRELKAERLKNHHRNVSDLVSEFEKIVLWQQNEEKKAVVGQGQFRLVQSLSHLQLTEAVFAAKSDEEQRELYSNYLQTPLSRYDEQLQDNVRTIPNDRKGKKKGDRLGRMASSASCAPIGTVVGSHAEPNEWENNNNFFLIFANPQTKKCASCQNDILHNLNIPGERLVIMHSERYHFPMGLGRDRWKNAKITLNRTRPMYYHATAHCIYKRFREIYFHSSVLNVEATGVRGEIREYGTDLRHPSITTL